MSVTKVSMHLKNIILITTVKPAVQPFDQILTSDRGHKAAGIVKPAAKKPRLRWGGDSFYIASFR